MILIKVLIHGTILSKYQGDLLFEHCVLCVIVHSTSVVRHTANNLLMDRKYAFAFELKTCKMERKEVV